MIRRLREMYRRWDEAARLRQRIYFGETTWGRQGPLAEVPIRYRVTAKAVVIRADGTTEELPEQDLGYVFHQGGFGKDSTNIGGA